jgi:hypothetical protein
MRPPGAVESTLAADAVVVRVEVMWVRRKHGEVVPAHVGAVGPVVAGGCRSRGYGPSRWSAVASSSAERWAAVLEERRAVGLRSRAVRSASAALSLSWWWSWWSRSSSGWWTAPWATEARWRRGARRLVGREWGATACKTVADVDRC